MHPTDHTSMLGLYCLYPKKSYGALYHMVHTLTVDWKANFLARPKSATFITPE